MSPKKKRARARATLAVAHARHRRVLRLAVSACVLVCAGVVLLLHWRHTHDTSTFYHLSIAVLAERLANGVISEV